MRDIVSNVESQVFTPYSGTAGIRTPNLCTSYMFNHSATSLFSIIVLSTIGTHIIWLLRHQSVLAINISEVEGMWGEHSFTVW